MTMHEKYANPGVYLDTDRHEQLIRENREAYRRERRERTLQEIREIESTLEMGHVSRAEAQRLREKKDRLVAELEADRP